MAMSKKHYVEVAAILAKRHTMLERIADGGGAARGFDLATRHLEVVARELAAMFARDNPKFDAIRFLEATKGVK